MTKIIKRDGKLADFDIKKVICAIMKAQEAAGKSDFKEATSIAEIVQASIPSDQISVIEVHAMIESILMDRNKSVAHHYIEFRSKRDAVRESKSPLSISIEGLLKKTNTEVSTENANKDAKVFPVQRDLIAGIVSKHFARTMLLPDEIMKAHDSGDLHFHDLDYSPFLPYTNCCLVDLKKLLDEGFRLGNAQLESPKSIGVACAVTAQITAQVASHQYGGTTFANVDQVLAPYAHLSFQKHVKKALEYKIDDYTAYAQEMTRKEINDGIQALEYEINTLFTTNGQFPFVTFTFGMGTNWYEREIQRAILEVRLRGLGKEGITAVFPKLVMFLEEGINVKPEDPNYDIKKLALDCSAKRLYPDIISAKLNREITGSSVPVSPMGCRSFLSVWRDADGAERLDGRNNLGVVSLNLPRIAIESGGDMDLFKKIFKERLELCYSALDYRLKRFEGVTAEVAPILYTEGAFGVKMKPEDKISELFKDGRSSISLGYIGVHEMMQIMYNDPTPFDNVEAQVFGKWVVEEMKKEVARWKEETGIGYSLYSTPSESLCHRFCKLDREKFGEVAGITDKGWYMNSFHLDVDHKVSPFEKIDFEADYHKIASGGHISYCEFPSMINNPKGLEAVWDYAITKLAYFGTNVPSDKCFECKFEGETTCTSDGFVCPSCGNKDPSKMSVTRRVCGYLGSVTTRPWNPGKMAEMQKRVKHVDS